MNQPDPYRPQSASYLLALTAWLALTAVVLIAYALGHTTFAWIGGAVWVGLLVYIVLHKDRNPPVPQQSALLAGKFDPGVLGPFKRGIRVLALRKHRTSVFVLNACCIAYAVANFSHATTAAYVFLGLCFIVCLYLIWRTSHRTERINAIIWITCITMMNIAAGFQAWSVAFSCAVLMLSVGSFQIQKRNRRQARERELRQQRAQTHTARLQAVNSVSASSHNPPLAKLM